MAVTPTPIFPQTLLSKTTALTNATSTTTPTNLLSAQTNGCKIEEILVSSTDTSARDLQIYINIGATNFLLCTVAIPATAGFVNNIATVSIFSALSGATTLFPLPKDPNGNPYLYLDPSSSLTAEPLTTITTGKQIAVTVIGGSF